MTSELSRSTSGNVHSSYDVVANIVRSNPAIESLTLVIYEGAKSWRDATRPADNPDLPLLLNGLAQDRGPRIFKTIPRAEVSEENLRQIARSWDENKLVGACSAVKLADGQSAHIPMMDFSCAPSNQNLGLLVRLITDLRQGRGYILMSGRSYHYYGFRLLSEAEWKIFLGKCLLMSGFADDRYVGHQLVDGHCVLRVSSGRSKGNLPIVVAELR